MFGAKLRRVTSETSNSRANVFFSAAALTALGVGALICGAGWSLRG